jgi:serine/threonine protein kinase
MEPISGPVCPRCGWNQGSPPDSPTDLAPGTLVDEAYIAWAARGANHRTVVPASAQNKLRFENGLRKFQEEGEALAIFQSNPGIVSVIKFFSENGTAYLFMHYEEGATFEKYLNDQGGRIDFPQAMAIAMPVMDALRAAHEAGILHRDISPENIFINRSKQVKLLDFGAAKRDMTCRTGDLRSR